MTSLHSTTVDELTKNGAFGEIYEEKDSMWLPLFRALMAYRRALHDFLERPASSKGAQFWSFFVVILILLSSLSFILQTLPAFYDRDLTLWFSMETIIVIIFTAELVLRVLCTPNIVTFVTDPLNVIDFLAVLPYYFDFLVVSVKGKFTMLSIIRIVRILRVFKISRHAKPIVIMGQALLESIDVLYLAVLFVSVAMMVTSSFIYFAERGTWDETTRQWMRCMVNDPLTGTCTDKQVSPYQSIFHAFWWSITTLTTVGYGDAYPVTPFGKIIGGITMLCGVLVIALPSSLLGTKFEVRYQKYMEQVNKRKQEKKEEKKRRLESGKTAFETKAEDMLNSVGLSEESLKRKFSRSSMALKKRLSTHQVGSEPSTPRASSIDRRRSQKSFDFDMQTFDESSDDPKDLQPAHEQAAKIKKIAKVFGKSQPKPDKILCKVLLKVNDQVTIKQIIPVKATTSLADFVESLMKKVNSNLHNENHDWAATIDKLTVFSDGYEILLETSVTVGEYADARNHLSLQIESVVSDRGKASDQSVVE